MKTYSLAKSRKNDEVLKKLLPGGVHHNFGKKNNKGQICFAKGKKSRLWDLDGNEYLDLNAKFGAMILGHNPPYYNKALKDCIDEVLAVDMTYLSREVCEILKNNIPYCEMVRFGLSGTEMVGNALRLARAYTGKNRFLRFEGHFHGTGDSMIGGVTDDYESPVPKDSGIGAFTTLGRAELALETQSFLIPWNNYDLLKRTIDKYKEEIAAVIMEPICVNGGSILPTPEYLNGLRTLCTDNNIVLIFDELITGIRLGLGGAQTYYGVTPDISIWGKSISNGSAPVSVLMGKKEIMKMYEDAKVIHGGTYNGYPLGLAAIKATCNTLGESSIDHYRNMDIYGEKIHAEFLSAAKEVGLDMVIQGPRTCASYHCSKHPIESHKELTDELVAKNGIIRECLLSYGILVSSISRIYTNITLDDDDVEFFKNRIGYALEDAQMIIKRLYR